MGSVIHSCPICQKPHAPDRTCDGASIDWAARKARALAWIHRPMAKHEQAYNTNGYPYQEEPKEANQ